MNLLPGKGIIMQKNNNMPIGLAMSLAMDEEAREHFSNLSQEKRAQVEQMGREVKTKAEMEALVRNIGKGIF